MKHLFLFIAITLSIVGCKSKPDKRNLKPTQKIKQRISSTVEDTAEVDPSKLAGCLATSYLYPGGGSEEFYPGTYNEKTYVYNSIKADGKIIDTLPFNTSVNVLKAYMDFYLVCTPKSKSGYIKKTDLYLHKIFDSQGISDNYYYYLAGLTKYPPKADRELNSEGCGISILKMTKIAEKSSKILNVYTDSIMGSGYTIKKINRLALKNAAVIFHITYGCMHDIETDVDLFIVDNGKNISRLLLSSGSGDGGYGDGSIVYFPITLGNGKKIVLAKNGIISIDDTNLKPEIYPYPADCGVPIDELVVVQDYSEADDSEGEQKYNKDGTAIDYTTITSTTYYRWDGITLKKVKTIKGK